MNLSGSYPGSVVFLPISRAASGSIEEVVGFVSTHLNCSPAGLALERLLLLLHHILHRRIRIRSTLKFVLSAFALQEEALGPSL